MSSAETATCSGEVTAEFPISPLSQSIIAQLCSFNPSETLSFVHVNYNAETAGGNFNLPSDKNIVIAFYNSYIFGDVNLLITTYNPTITPTLPTNNFAIPKYPLWVTADIKKIVSLLSSDFTHYLAIRQPTTTALDNDSRLTYSSSGAGISVVGTDSTLSNLLKPGGDGLIVVITKNSPLMNINLSRSSYSPKLYTTPSQGGTNSAGIGSLTYGPTLFWVCNGIWLFILIIILCVCLLSGSSSESDKSHAMTTVIGQHGNTSHKSHD